MINDDPGAANLVSIALKTFREAILPAVPADQRFNALMIANALGIAERELLAGPSAEAPLETAVGGLLGGAGRLSDQLPQLCAAIDAGTFDGPDRQRELRAVLMNITRARLAVTNPRLLAGGR